MRILVACEESQAVMSEFRKLGHDCWSADLQPASGDYPEYHHQGDVLDILDDGWQMMIGHPDCTYLTNAGVRWLSTDRSRWAKLDAGCEFFLKLWNADIEKIALENPIPHKHAVERLGVTYTQKIQPMDFGIPETKATCLWLKNLPPLMATCDARLAMSKLPKRESNKIHYMSPGPERAKLRSKTEPAIAKQYAAQWG